MNYKSLKVCDFATLKQYNDRFKLVYHKLPVRQTGYQQGYKRVFGVNDTKLQSNIIRAKSKVFEYAICNDFDYFVTLTIDPRKYDRKNLSAYYKDFGQFLQNYNRKYKVKIQYLFIPEMHKDGSWHMHGFISGIPPGQIVTNQFGYLDWLDYKKKFGYISMDSIKNKEAASKYITKYINKDLSDCIKDLNAHLYYCSQGLKKAVEIKRGTLSANNIPFAFENDYVKIKWYADKVSALTAID